MFKFLLMITTVVLPSAVFAADAGDIRLMSETKISLTDAIKAAETYQKGQAIEASLDDDSFAPAYEVNVVSENRIYDVRVDGVTGKVIGAREDMDD